MLSNNLKDFKEEMKNNTEELKTDIKTTTKDLNRYREEMMREVQNQKGNITKAQTPNKLPQSHMLGNEKDV